jgi:uncharacterized membrane protein
MTKLNLKNDLTVDLVKTVTYRIFASLVTFSIGFAFSKNFKFSLALGVSDFVLKPLLYFIHERIWRKIK